MPHSVRSAAFNGISDSLPYFINLRQQAQKKLKESEKETRRLSLVYADLYTSQRDLYKFCELYKETLPRQKQQLDKLLPLDRSIFLTRFEAKLAAIKISRFEQEGQWLALQEKGLKVWKELQKQHAHDVGGFNEKLKNFYSFDAEQEKQKIKKYFNQIMKVIVGMGNNTLDETNSRQEVYGYTLSYTFEKLKEQYYQFLITLKEHQDGLFTLPSVRVFLDYYKYQLLKAQLKLQLCEQRQQWRTKELQQYWEGVKEQLKSEWIEEIKGKSFVGEEIVIMGFKATVSEKVGKMIDEMHIYLRHPMQQKKEEAFEDINCSILALYYGIDSGIESHFRIGMKKEIKKIFDENNIFENEDRENLKKKIEDNPGKIQGFEASKAAANKKLNRLSGNYTGIYINQSQELEFQLKSLQMAGNFIDEQILLFKQKDFKLLPMEILKNKWEKFKSKYENETIKSILNLMMGKLYVVLEESDTIQNKIEKLRKLRVGLAEKENSNQINLIKVISSLFKKALKLKWTNEIIEDYWIGMIKDYSSSFNPDDIKQISPDDPDSYTFVLISELNNLINRSSLGFEKNEGIQSRIAELENEKKQLEDENDLLFRKKNRLSTLMQDPKNAKDAAEELYFKHMGVKREKSRKEHIKSEKLRSQIFWLDLKIAVEQLVFDVTRVIKSGLRKFFGLLAIDLNEEQYKKLNTKFEVAQQTNSNNVDISHTRAGTTVPASTVQQQTVVTKSENKEENSQIPIPVQVIEADLKTQVPGAEPKAPLLTLQLS